MEEEDVQIGRSRGPKTTITYFDGFPLSKNVYTATVSVLVDAEVTTSSGTTPTFTSIAATSINTEAVTSTEKVAGTGMATGASTKESNSASQNGAMITAAPAWRILALEYHSMSKIG